ncbi:serine-threonine protein kinase, plant-type, putative [Ricinus communis]|uniref:Serine-threonine protein kinase, plant-type, putative n=1 Tax=Ricinus communis TaxID=3988 RepID=B9RF81_RICCO|nr:serine-threonine protein kinase, plant-type, putative [Ricinus communis]
MIACFRAKQDREAEAETAFVKNGRMLVEASISFNNGGGNPIRWFSVKDLNNATKNYDHSQVFWDDGEIVFTSQMSSPISEIVFASQMSSPISEIVFASQMSSPISEIVFASQMNSHKDALKLLGCCLETELPILVFESAENGTLHDRIYNPHLAGFQPLSWTNRLRIAIGAATAIAYLHTAFPRPIIHRDIKP